jgi:hypothetical protein
MRGLSPGYPPSFRLKILKDPQSGKRRAPQALLFVLSAVSDPNPSALRFRITSRTRSSLVKATLAFPATSMPCADSSAVGARRQVTTDPEPPAYDPHQPPSLVIVDLTHPQPFTHCPSVGGEGAGEKGRT